MKLPSAIAIMCANLIGVCHAQTPNVLRDLEPLSPVLLTAAELKELLPGARMTRSTDSGNMHSWSNDSDGTFIIRSDNKGTSASSRASTAPGKWNLTEDGRYCVRIEWKASTDDWCRVVIRTSQGYFLAKAMKVGTEKVYPITISK